MCDFIPGTTERHIGNNIVFRPIRSWHSLTYAGEGLFKVSGDGSGCLRIGTKECSAPLTVTHRLYWNKSNPEKTISAFLSYPNAMGACSKYFWEIYPAKEDIERFDDEDKMEAVILKLLEEDTDAQPS